MPKIAVLVPTYLAPECRLLETLQTVKNQTYKNYKVFLIGDKYENKERFEKASQIIDPDKIYAFNRKIAPEREKYTGNELWISGGVSASNFGLRQIAKEADLKWVAFLDHDDLWEKDHLENIAKAIKGGPENLALVATKGIHVNGAILPPQKEVGNYYPEPCNVLKSSVSIDTYKLPLMFTDTAKIGAPADAYYWEQLTDYMKKHNLKGTLINKITITHDRENTHCT